MKKMWSKWKRQADGMGTVDRMMYLKGIRDILVEASGSVSMDLVELERDWQRQYATVAAALATGAPAPVASPPLTGDSMAVGARPPHGWMRLVKGSKVPLPVLGSHEVSVGPGSLSPA
jgi:hypothetical protein